MQMPRPEIIKAVKEIAAEKADGICGVNWEMDYYEGIANALSWVLGNCKCVITETKLIFDYDDVNGETNLERRIEDVEITD